MVGRLTVQDLIDAFLVCMVACLGIFLLDCLFYLIWGESASQVTVNYIAD